MCSRASRRLTVIGQPPATSEPGQMDTWPGSLRPNSGWSGSLRQGPLYCAAGSAAAAAAASSASTAAWSAATAASVAASAAISDVVAAAASVAEAAASIAESAAFSAADTASSCFEQADRANATATALRASLIFMKDSPKERWSGKETQTGPARKTANADHSVRRIFASLQQV